MQEDNNIWLEKEKEYGFNTIIFIGMMPHLGDKPF